MGADRGSVPGARRGPAPGRHRCAGPERRGATARAGRADRARRHRAEPRLDRSPAARAGVAQSPRSVVAHGEPVRVGRDAGRLVVEAEIAIVIGRDTGDPASPLLDERNAHEFVLGVTAVDDISYPDRAELDERNFESKGGDGSTPLGPWIDTDASIDDLPLALELDGERVRDSSASAMPVPVRESLAYVARWVRLGPGDVVMAGAPLSNHEAHPGQTATVVVGDLRLGCPCAERAPSLA
ncbi:fumarylacetoacetate hydrolase family protein [Agrococcus sp. Marseille-Q4369]|nr:fumarylacetoacetate hydrolase family protein [Agrococcus sp. Marseille-Q4369]